MDLEEGISCPCVHLRVCVGTNVSKGSNYFRVVNRYLFESNFDGSLLKVSRVIGFCHFPISSF